LFILRRFGEPTGSLWRKLKTIEKSLRENQLSSSRKIAHFKVGCRAYRKAVKKTEKIENPFWENQLSSGRKIAHFEAGLASLWESCLFSINKVKRATRIGNFRFFAGISLAAEKAHHKEGGLAH